MVNKHQKVEVKMHREVNNRNPLDLLRPLGFLSLSEHTVGACVKEGEQAAVELVYHFGAGNGVDSPEA